MTTSAGYSGCRYGAEHEALQPPGDHESHNDSVYFNLTPGDGAGVAGAVVRIGMRPGDVGPIFLNSLISPPAGRGSSNFGAQRGESNTSAAT